MVQMGEEKMSKSLGNLITIKQALKNYSADAIRVFVLSSHYRSPLTYSEEILEAAEKGAERLRQTVNSKVSDQKTDKKIDAEQYRKRFIEAMDDDFNTAQAVAALFDLTREINRYEGERKDAAEAREALTGLGGVLGLTFKEPEGAPLDSKAISALQKSIIARIRKAKLYKVIEQVEKMVNEQGLEPEDAASYLNLLRGVRDALRKEKHFQLADEIRDKLAELGITFEDTPQGTVWKRKR